MHTFVLAAVLAAGPLLLDVPFVRQKPDFGGEAAAEMGLRHLGRAVSQDDVFDASGVDPSEGRGARTDELARALRHWLQEKGVLTTLVRRAIEQKGEDPSGFRALQEALGAEPDALRPEWERHVHRLTRRGS